LIRKIAKMTQPYEQGQQAGETDEATSRVEEMGEPSEPDAPTAEEENEGMSTILDADPILGVQSNESEE
jgi:hypothetical protein